MRNIVFLFVLSSVLMACSVPSTTQGRGLTPTFEGAVPIDGFITYR